MSEAIKTAQEALNNANAMYLDELRQDSERSEGSGAQERRREENQQRMREEITRSENALEVAKQADAHAMQAAFEQTYQRDWNDPAGTEMKAVWVAAWAAARQC